MLKNNVLAIIIHILILLLILLVNLIYILIAENVQKFNKLNAFLYLIDNHTYLFSVLSLSLYFAFGFYFSKKKQLQKIKDTKDSLLSVLLISLISFSILLITYFGVSKGLNDFIWLNLIGNLPLMGPHLLIEHTLYHQNSAFEFLFFIIPFFPTVLIWLGMNFQLKRFKI